MDQDLIVNRFKEGIDNLVQSGRIELIQQGHKATGKLINSLEGVVTSSDLDKLVGVIFSEEYGLIVDAGVSASRVPYSGSGGGGKSLYIEALLRWAQVVRPSLQEKELKSFVFAVANTHKKEGISSRGSYSYSSNNRRTEWIKFGLEDYVPVLEGDLNLFSLITKMLEDKVEEALK